MKKTLASFAVVGLAMIVPAEAGQPVPGDPPAAADSNVRFAGLKTIYAASGVLDSGDPANQGIATVVVCTNTTAQNADIRVAFYDGGGTRVGMATHTVLPVRGFTVATHGVQYLAEAALGTGGISQGLLYVQATQAAVFCSAMIANAAGTTASGIELHLVRYNAFPGTTE